MATPPPMEGNTFIVDESSSEMAWLLNQEQILTKGMEGLFPESFDLSNVKRILDVAAVQVVGYLTWRENTLR